MKQRPLSQHKAETSHRSRNSSLYDGQLSKKSQLKHQINQKLRLSTNGRIQTDYEVSNPSKSYKIRELEIEVTEFKMECKRLRLMLKARQKEELKLEDKDGLMKDNIKLSRLVAELEEENIAFKVQNKQLDQSNKKLNFKYMLCKNQNEKILQELNSIKKDLIPAINDNQIRVLNNKLKKEIQDKEQLIINLTIELQEWKKQYNELEKQFDQISHEFIAMKNKKQKEKSNFKEKILQLEREKKLLEEEMLKINDSDTSRSSSEGYILDKRRTGSNKRVARINISDVKRIGRIIRLMMIEKNISFEEMENYIINESQSVVENISIHQLITQLKLEPFSLTSTEQATLVARYLIEDNQEELIFYDQNRQQEQKIVKSIFKQLIGKYELINQKETEKINEYFRVLMKKYKLQLMQVIKSQLKSQKNETELCSFDDILQSFKTYEIDINQKQRDYLQLIVLKKYGPTFEKIKYEELFENLMKIQTENFQKE